MKRRAFQQLLSLEGRSIGPGSPCFVIAEAGVNHNGDPALARRLVDAAADAGADAVKFQTFDPALLVTTRAAKADYQQRNDASSRTQREMLDRLVLPRELHHELQSRARERGLIFLSSPFDEGSADFLATLALPAFKIPSGEVTNHPFLEHLASLGRPLLLSTGMSTLAEVTEAVAVIRAAGDPPLALFHCVSNYPSAPEETNLRAMGTLRARFGVPVGWSDHTMGVEISLAAAALGADLIEKHLTLDRTLPGPDHKASLEPAEMAALVRGVRAVTAALGNGEKVPVDSELAVARVARRSLHWREALPAGTLVERRHLIALRPGDGLSPARLPELIGRRLTMAISAGAPVELGELDLLAPARELAR